MTVRPWLKSAGWVWVMLAAAVAVMAGCHRPDVMYVDSYYNGARPAAGERTFRVVEEAGEGGEPLKGRLLGRAIVNDGNAYRVVDRRLGPFRIAWGYGVGYVPFQEGGPRPEYYFAPLPLEDRVGVGDAVRRGLAARGFREDETDAAFEVRVAARFGEYSETSEPVTRWETETRTRHVPVTRYVRDGEGRRRRVTRYEPVTYTTEGWRHYGPGYWQQKGGAVEVRVFRMPAGKSRSRSGRAWRSI